MLNKYLLHEYILSHFIFNNINTCDSTEFFLLAAS